MKKQLLFLALWVSISINGWSQVSFTSFAANPVEQGKPVTVNFTYSAVATTDFVYVGIFKRSAAGVWMATVTESTKNGNVNFPVTSLAANTPGTYNINIPAATVPSASLANGEYYDMSLELYGAGWAPKRGSAISPKLTVAAAGTLGIDEISLKKGFVLYPNPVTNILSLKNRDGVAIKALKITNILGETVFSDVNAKSTDAIDVSNLSSGTYIISIDSGDGIQQSKFFKK